MAPESSPIIQHNALKTSPFGFLVPCSILPVSGAKRRFVSLSRLSLQPAAAAPDFSTRSSDFW